MKKSLYFFVSLLTIFTMTSCRSNLVKGLLMIAYEIPPIQQVESYLQYRNQLFKRGILYLFKENGKFYMYTRDADILGWEYRPDSHAIPSKIKLKNYVFQPYKSKVTPALLKSAMSSGRSDFTRFIISNAQLPQSYMDALTIFENRKISSITQLDEKEFFRKLKLVGDGKLPHPQIPVIKVNREDGSHETIKYIKTPSEPFYYYFCDENP